MKLPLPACYDTDPYRTDGNLWFRKDTWVRSSHIRAGLYASGCH